VLIHIRQAGALGVDPLKEPQQVVRGGGPAIQTRIRAVLGPGDPVALVGADGAGGHAGDGEGAASGKVELMGFHCEQKS